MEKLQHLLKTFSWLLLVIIMLALWETVWKMIALWKSARSNHLVWFIFIGILNTIGILPIIYILTHKNKAA